MLAIRFDNVCRVGEPIFPIQSFDTQTALLALVLNAGWLESRLSKLVTTLMDVTVPPDTFQGTDDEVGSRGWGTRGWRELAHGGRSRRW